jgi:hypothetical protein
MKESQLYFDFYFDCKIDQWMKNMQTCYRSLPDSFSMRNIFSDSIMNNWPSSVPAFPMNLKIKK